MLHVAKERLRNLSQPRRVCIEKRGAQTASIEGELVAMDYIDITKMSKQTSDNVQALLKTLILATIAGAAISARLFSIVR